MAQSTTILENPERLFQERSRARVGESEGRRASEESTWTLRRAAGSEWCSLSCTSTGWKLSMHDGGFTVVAETTGEGRPDTGAITALRSRLHDLGWNDVPQLTLRPKPDRRRRTRA